MASPSVGARRRRAAMSASLKPFGVARRPARVDAVHLADRGVLGEAVDEDDVVGVTQILHLLDDGEVGRIAEADAPAQFLAAGLQQVIERAALPGFGSLAFGGAAILGGGVLLDVVVAPAEDGAFVHRMQRVDDHKRARDRKARRVALLAEFASAGRFPARPSRPRRMIQSEMRSMSAGFTDESSAGSRRCLRRRRLCRSVGRGDDTPAIEILVEHRR